MLQPSKLPKEACKMVNLYLRLPFAHIQIPCPYWMNLLDKNKKGSFSGKGTPKQIVHATLTRARSLGVRIDNLSSRRLNCFMRENRIGVDCSGFVFHLVNKINIDKTGASIANRLIKDNTSPSWRVAWRCNANRLTCSEYTKKVSLKEIKAGDLIRTMGGNHVLFVIEVKENSVVYAHSSYLSTKTCGVHLSQIQIVDGEKALDKQKWLEKTPEEKNYGEVYFDKNKGDSIRRFKWWN